jgi:hypothetical protein
MAGRYFKGNYPLEDDGWINVGEIDNGVLYFSVFEKKQVNGWKQIKVCSKGKTRNKANYWLAWSGERFANGHDYKAMINHQGWMEKNLTEILTRAKQ